MDKERAFDQLAKTLFAAKDAEAEGNADMAKHMYELSKRIVDALNAEQAKAKKA